MNQTIITINHGENDWPNPGTRNHLAALIDNPNNKIEIERRVI